MLTEEFRVRFQGFSRTSPQDLFAPPRKRLSRITLDDSVMNILRQKLIFHLTAFSRIIRLSPEPSYEIVCNFRVVFHPRPLNPLRNVNSPVTRRVEVYYARLQSDPLSSSRAPLGIVTEQYHHYSGVSSPPKRNKQMEKFSQRYPTCSFGWHRNRNVKIRFHFSRFIVGIRNAFTSILLASALRKLHFVGITSKLFNDLQSFCRHPMSHRVIFLASKPLAIPFRSLFMSYFHGNCWYGKTNCAAPHLHNSRAASEKPTNWVRGRKVKNLHFSCAESSTSATRPSVFLIFSACS